MLATFMSDTRQKLRGVFDAQFRLWAGAAFMALALVSIQYEEIIAPGVGRLSDAWGSAASDVGRKLTSFSL